MVIQHYHISALGRGDRPMRERAAVNADNQVVIARQTGHGGVIGAIALVDPVWNIQRRLLTHLPQIDHQQRRRRPAIHVIIGKDRNPLAPFHRLQETCGGGLHVLHPARVGQQLLQLRRQKPGGLMCGHSAPCQHLANSGGQAGFLRQMLTRAGLIDAGSPPAAPGQRGLDTQKTQIRTPVMCKGRTRAGPGLSSFPKYLNPDPSCKR